VTVTVYIWNKDATNKMDVGHTAVGIDDKVYGYYPTDMNGDGAYGKEDLDNSTGELHFDNAEEFKKSYEDNKVTAFTIQVSTAEKGEMIKYYSNLKTNPGQYELTGSNCTSTALDALKAGGVMKFALNFLVSPNGLKGALNEIMRVSKIEEITVGTPPPVVPQNGPQPQ
jgi:hypothetical protein